VINLGGSRKVFGICGNKVKVIVKKRADVTATANAIALAEAPTETISTKTTCPGRAKTEKETNAEKKDLNQHHDSLLQSLTYLQLRLVLALISHSLTPSQKAFLNDLFGKKCQ
jgi:hypothetical protein